MEEEKREPSPLRRWLERGRHSVFFRDFAAFLRDTWFLLRKNWSAILPFLLVYSLFNMTLTYMAVNLTVRQALWFLGETYLATDNLARFFSAPATVVLVLVLCIVICFLHMVEIGGITHAYSMSLVGKKSSMEGMVMAGLEAGAKGLLPQNWLVLPFIMVLLPLTGFFSLSFTSLQVVIPGFVLDYIRSNTVYDAAYRLAYLGMVLVEVMYIFAMSFYLLQKDNFFSACRKSRRLIRGNYLKTFVFLLLLSCILSTAVVVLAAAASALLVQARTLFSSGLTRTEAALLARWSRAISQFAVLVVAPAVNIAALTTLFFRYVEDKNMLSRLSPESFRDRKLNRRQRAALILGSAAALAVSMAVYGSDYSAEAPGMLPRPAVAAHRGDSATAPENSLPAFELAILEYADWIELDVHQTRDGVIVVCHDDNLKRICGKDVYVYDLTYEEIQRLDVGSWFSEDYAGLRLATLDEVLKLCKDKIFVQIEIKPTSHDVNVEESVLQIINDNGMHDQVLVHSLKSRPLIRLKELDPSLITCYCMVLAWEHIEDIPFADYYTVEEGNIDPELVSNVHKSGGKIFAWTVNSDESVQYLVDCGVDGILTDDPIMMRDVLDNCKYSGGLARYLRIYLDTLREF